MKRRTTILLVVLFFYLTIVSAQQQGQFTQYMYTPLIINPAYAGMEEVMSISFLHRSQWVGVNGAPVTQILTASTPLTDKLGIGLSVINDETGPASEVNFSADVSYILTLNENNLRLSFGIKGGFQHLNVDFNKLNAENPNDSFLNDNINSRFSPNIGAGFYLYNTSWYLGLSSPNLLSTEHFNSTAVSRVSNETHIYLIGGKNFTLNDNWKFKPTFMVKGVNNAPLTLDLSANFLFNDKFTTGISYRNQAAISGLLNVKVNNLFSIGYAYDYDTTNISSFTSGSHEVFLRFLFNRHRSVRQPIWMY